VDLNLFTFSYSLFSNVHKLSSQSISLALFMEKIYEKLRWIFSAAARMRCLKRSENRYMNVWVNRKSKIIYKIICWWYYLTVEIESGIFIGRRAIQWNLIEFNRLNWGIHLLIIFSPSCLARRWDIIQTLMPHERDNSILSSPSHSTTFRYCCLIWNYFEKHLSRITIGCCREEYWRLTQNNHDNIIQ
jgi:hypothetical protein